MFRILKRRNMRNRVPLFILIISTASIILSCKDVFERDLKKKDMVIYAPANELRSTISTITFWWNEIEGADGYNIQIVSPTFSSITKLVLDSNVSNNKFTFSLLPGDYQWRVKAYNNSSETEYLTYTLYIDSTANITQQTIILNSPADKDTTKSMSFTFKWNTIYNADDYRFEIWTPNFSGTNVLSVSLATDSFKYVLDEGAYEWGVRGQNSTTNTQYSKRSIFIDTTRPNTPVLIAPILNDTISDTISLDFSWSHGIVTGSSIKDSLYIYSDQAMMNIIRQKYLNSTTYTDSLGNGNFWWRVRSIDAAGNYSNYSSLRKFTVQ
jgi:hypothetical protein